MLLTTQRNRLIWSHISCQCSFHMEVKTPNNLNHPCHISTLRPQKTQRQSKANNSKMEAINNRATNLVHAQPWYTDAKLQLLSGSKFIQLYGYFYLRSLPFIKQLFIHPHGNDKSLSNDRLFRPRSILSSDLYSPVQSRNNGSLNNTDGRCVASSPFW